MIPRRLFLSGLLATCLPSTARPQGFGSAPPDMNDGWPVADLASAGLDPAAMSDLVDLVNAGVTARNVHAILVEHAGRLVFERYWTGRDGELGIVAHGPRTLHDIRSISKGVTSLLLGIALGGEADDALARPTTDFFPDRSAAGSVPDTVTLHHVLTMTAGLSWNETIVPYTARNDFVRLLSTDDPVGFVLSRPPQDAPGEVWSYNSGLTDLVGGVIEQITGQPLIDYAEEVLFAPLGIDHYEWWRPPAWPVDHFPSASAGLRLRARDLARIASVTMHGGRWQSRQIVPQEWITKATARQIGTAFGHYGYGYFWYRGRLVSGHQAIHGSGYGGQEIFILPDENLAITIYAGNHDDPDWALGARIAGRVVRALQ